MAVGFNGRIWCSQRLQLHSSVHTHSCRLERDSPTMIRRNDCPASSDARESASETGKYASSDSRSSPATRSPAPTSSKRRAHCVVNESAAASTIEPHHSLGDKTALMRSRGRCRGRCRAKMHAFLTQSALPRTHQDLIARSDTCNTSSTHASCELARLSLSSGPWWCRPRRRWVQAS